VFLLVRMHRIGATRGAVAGAPVQGGRSAPEI